MNKIKVRDNIEEIILKEDTILTLEDINKNIKYIINDNIKIFNYIKNSNLNIEYEINESAEINIFTIDTTLNIDLNLNKKNINLNYNYSTLNKNKNDYKVNINHNKENQTSKIVNHGINLENNKLNFIVNTNVPKKATKTKANQDSKIILFGEKTAEIHPNLLINNNDIEANHSAYIGDFKKDEIFYLKSRGLPLESARKLLAKSFLIGSMNITYKEINIILEKLNKYWR